MFNIQLKSSLSSRKIKSITDNYDVVVLLGNIYETHALCTVKLYFTLHEFLNNFMAGVLTSEIRIYFLRSLFCCNVIISLMRLFSAVEQILNCRNTPIIIPHRNVWKKKSLKKYKRIELKSSIVTNSKVKGYAKSNVQFFV